MRPYAVFAILATILAGCSKSVSESTPDGLNDVSAGVQTHPVPDAVRLPDSVSVAGSPSGTGFDSRNLRKASRIIEYAVEKMENVAKSGGSNFGSIFSEESKHLAEFHRDPDVSEQDLEYVRLCEKCIGRKAGVMSYPNNEKLAALLADSETAIRQFAEFIRQTHPDLILYPLTKEKSETAE